ncbi:mitochondrial uncoupling protein [Trifolium repens]|nr:mitochondrial uncoupling protein [Trifolium repens]
MLGTVGTIAREEGLSALWKGIVSGLHRQCLYGGLRIGLYEPVKTFYTGKDHVGDVPLSKKILAAFTTGAVAIAVANPTDLVKVRLQAEGKLPPGVPKRYSGSLNAYSSIVRQEGVRALWTGLGPNIARNSIINAAELASYDQVKQTILKIPGFTDDVVTHLFAGLGAVLSAYGDTKLVMKGISDGACDYLLKPVRLEELKNIWQHVIRKKKSDPKEKSKTCKPDKTASDSGSGLRSAGTENTDENGKLTKKRKDRDEDEDEDKDNGNDNEDPSAQKKPRVVWSVELHRKFVAAVNQLGIDNAIAPPRKDGVEELSKRLVGTLLELMDGIGINGGLVVIAATNRPDHIDPTLRQGGRFDKDIEIGRRSASLGDSMDLAILGY